MIFLYLFRICDYYDLSNFPMNSFISLNSHRYESSVFPHINRLKVEATTQNDSRPRVSYIVTFKSVNTDMNL